MFRKSAVAAALLFISASPDTYALGLGSIDMQSALNQPLAAVIELTSATGTDLSQVKISLASREDHQRAGLSRTRILSDFRFNVETGSNGQPVVRISSHDAIHEPFLEFMLQLEWSNGRLLRQYTVLVDPPVTIPAAPAVPAAPVARAPAPVTYETARPVAARPAVTAPARSVSTPAATPAADSYGPIRRNETLWDIAKRLRPDESVSIEQMMLALQRANPHAFMNNNINHMKAGVTLKIPERNDIAAMTRREATAETRRQYAEWKAPREVPQQQQPAEVTAAESTAAETAIAETATEAATPAEEMPVTTEARLQLTAPEDEAVEGVATAGDPGTTAASPDDTSKLSQQLALVSEEAEANRAQSEELQSRVNELEQQIATMQRLLELKSDELASMQQLAASEPAVTEPAVESEPEVATTEAAATEAVAVAGVDSQTVAEKARGIINRLMDNPMLAGLGALVAMILGGILWVSTRQKNNQGLFDDEMTFDDQLAQTGDIEETGPVPLVADIDEYTEPVPEPAAASHQQNEAAGDPLTEADVYLAYGRIQQAEDVLQAAMQNDPADNAVRHKLLEIYHQAGNATAFDSLASDYHESVSEDDSEWLTIAAMGNELSPGNDLYRAAGSGESEVESVGEFDMDLSGMEDLVEDSGPADTELPESIEFNLDDIGTETVSFEEPEDESEGLLDSADEVTTKLDLARAYIDMGDPEGARSILTEVMEEGSDAQKLEADTIISQLA
jgi:pilus assembly protein FimV